MPKRFDFPSRSEVWFPLQLNVSKDARDNRSFPVVARLKQGVTLEAARAEMETITARLAREYPVTNGGWGLQIERLQDSIVGRLGSLLFLLSAAVLSLLG